MKTFNVKKTERDEKTNYPIETKIIGTVTAYTFTDAMRKAASRFNDEKWNDISVEIKKETCLISIS